MKSLETELTQRLGIKTPIICGAMYPCSNPELIAAVSEAGGIGIIQPISLVYAYKLDFEEAMKQLRKLTQKPLGFNAIVESSSKVYTARMKEWIDIALDYNVRFFVTALGNPKWVVDQVKPLGGIVFHDVTERKWALKALEAGVDGLICVNNRAGGHSGELAPDALFESLKDLKVPLVCAGGIGDENAFEEALRIGYSGVQMGTRFIATNECQAHESYKHAIIAARAEDIVRTVRVTGVPLAVIKNDYVERVGTEAGSMARWALQNPRTKHWMRLFYTLISAWKLKKSLKDGLSTKDYWQAGKSVEGVEKIESVGAIVTRFTDHVANKLDAQMSQKIQPFSRKL